MPRTARTTPATKKSAAKASKLRFAVIGAGHIAQNAVLPGFANARKTCELAAIFSSDPKKRRALAKQYALDMVLQYEEFERASDDFDAVYIATPNSEHRAWVERAAKSGKHVLCEKPMATSSEDCQAMIDACRDAGVKLMIAYRLHFEPANLSGVRLIRQGKIGTPRLFHSAFSMQVKADNVRTEAAKGGGPLFDIGIYCINAARYLFGEEPVSVVAMAGRGDDPRFAEVEENFAGTLEFPGGKLASFVCGFGASDAGWYQVIGEKGDLVADPAYEYEGELEQRITVKEKTKTIKHRARDQFGPELIYFAECVQRGQEPEPGGAEGLIDVRIIEAMFEAARTGRRVDLGRLPKDAPPRPQQAFDLPPAQKERLVNVEAAHED